MGKQGIIVIVCVVAIVAAVVVVVMSQGGRGPSEKAKGQPMQLTCVKCNKGVSMTSQEWAKLTKDETTGYGKCPECGAFGLWTTVQCPHCKKTVPAPPANAGGEYKCPECGKNVLEPPARRR